MPSMCTCVLSLFDKTTTPWASLSKLSEQRIMLHWWSQHRSMCTVCCSVSDKTTTPSVSLSRLSGQCITLQWRSQLPSICTACLLCQMKQPRHGRPYPEYGSNALCSSGGLSCRAWFSTEIFSCRWAPQPDAHLNY